MTIKINNKEYQVKQTIRSLFLWEQISGRSFEIKNMLDNYLYFYCILLANNDEFMSWDEFLDSIDKDPQFIAEITMLLSNRQDIDKLLESDEKNDNGKKKE